MRFFGIALVTCCGCAGQAVTLGVLGGGRATDDVTPFATPESRRYVFGPSIELDLPLRLAIEVDALYHRVGYEYGSTTSDPAFMERERANSWEVPLLLKYKLPVPAIKPFVEVGIAPRTISGTVTDSVTSTNPFTASYAGSYTYKATYPASVGLVVGGGVQLSVGRLQISPQARLTQWTGNPIFEINGLESTRQQLDLLVGVGWKLR